MRLNDFLMEMGVLETAYLLLMAKDSLQPLIEQFQELDGFYTGIGYAFPLKSERFLRQIIDHLPEAKIVKVPLPEQQSFSALRRAYKASYFRERLSELETQLASIKEIRLLHELSESAVQSAPLPAATKAYLAELLLERELLKEALLWAEEQEADSMHRR